MRRLPVLPAVLVTLVLSGCMSTTPGPGAGTAPAAAGDAPIPWSLTECAFLVAFVPVPAERLQPRVPEGFTVSTSGSPLAPVQGGAYLGVEAFRCASGAGLDGEVAPIDYGSFFTSVQPPEALAVEADGVYLKWDVLVPDAPRREALQAQGLPARDGTAAVERPSSVAPARVLGTLRMEGVGGFRIEGIVQGEGDLGHGSFVEYMARADGGVGLWRADWETHALERGRAVVVFEPGSWPAEVAGERAVGVFITGAWTFRNGTITPRLAGPA